ncbi:MAG TPA: response regulator [Candidatus Anaerofilum excrementigallinarum]|nr:response regulator [Candidatus Anaerofilum excrementigallinarum]
MKNRRVLIADDVELNRALLAMTFEEDYQILEAENGRQALEQLAACGNQVQAILLDLVMPEMDGFAVLQQLKGQGLLDKIPVFLITAEENEISLRKAYELGAMDVINKPFMPELIRKRIGNVMELFNARGQLRSLVETQEQALQAQAKQLRAQARQLQQLNSSIIDTLSTVIEFRDCESGEHVKRIRNLTTAILEKLVEQYPEYGVLPQDIPLIAEAAVMHDVGKIAIPDSILNKPGKLTSEEFEIMKQHTVRGCEILQHVPQILESGLYQYCYDICRHHHERWNGKGYPDGLKGDAIPIWAQVVSLADVYDALISDRVYKKSFSREKTISMICGGECGEFNSRLLECFLQTEEQIYASMYANQQPELPMAMQLEWASAAMAVSPVDQLRQQLEWEQKWCAWLLAQNGGGISFSYNIRQDYLEYTPSYGEWFGESLRQFHALDFIKQDEHIDGQEKDQLRQQLKQLKAGEPDLCRQLTLQVKDGSLVPFDLRIQAVWYEDGQIAGYMGRLDPLRQP